VHRSSGLGYPTPAGCPLQSTVTREVTVIEQDGAATVAVVAFTQ
jgi:hypothetical protein